MNIISSHTIAFFTTIMQVDLKEHTNSLVSIIGIMFSIIVSLIGVIFVFYIKGKLDRHEKQIDEQVKISTKNQLDMKDIEINYLDRFAELKEQNNTHLSEIKDYVKYKVDELHTQITESNNKIDELHREHKVTREMISNLKLATN